MPGEVTVLTALNLIGGRTIAEREDGFANLKNILRRTKGRHGLKDVSVHRIYETLFEVAIDGKAAYLSTKTSSTRSSAESRLTAAASALRTAVEETVRSVRGKTFRALFDHVTQMIFTSDDTLFEPLALDYARCLTALFGYQPHVGHMRGDMREKYVDFCLKVLELPRAGPNDEDTAAGAQLSSTNGTSHRQASYRSSRSHYRDSNGSQGGHSYIKQVAEEVIASLALLTATPNAGVGMRYDLVFDGVFSFLRTGTSNMKSQQEAFTVINRCLLWTTTQDRSLTKKHLSQIIRLIRLYWSPKLAADRLRSEMLIALIHLHPYVVSAMHPRQDVTLRTELASVLDVIRTDYGNRQQRDQLLMTDVQLRTMEKTDESAPTIAMVVCSLRCSGAQAEANWMTLHIMASLTKLLSKDVVDEQSSDGDEEAEVSNPLARKRQKLTSEIDRLLESSATSRVPARITSLQVLLFLAQQESFSCRQLHRILEKLAYSCADDNADISSWALLAMSSFALQKTSRHEMLAKRWSSIWQMAVRTMSNANTSRPACHLLYIMMRARLVSFQTIADFVQTVTVSMDLNGPPIVADSVAQLLIHSVHLSQQSNPTNSIATAESVLGWLFRTFTPSRFTDRLYAIQQASFDAADVISIVSHCLGRPLATSHTSTERWPVWGPIAQAWLRSGAKQELVGYLLLLQASPHSGVKGLDCDETTARSAWQARPSCEAILLNNLSSELFRMQESWQQTAAKEVVSDMFTLFCKSVYIAASVAFCSEFRDTRRRDQLQNQAAKLLEVLTNYGRSAQCSPDKLDTIFATFSQGLVSLREDQSDPCKCEVMLCQCISSVTQARRERAELLEPIDRAEVDDFMDIDDEFDSQVSRKTDSTSDAQELLDDYTAEYGDLALRANISVYAALRSKQNSSHDSSDFAASVSSQVLDMIFSLPDNMIFAARGVITRLQQLGLDLTAEDGDRLADFCLNHLEDYEYERSEVALGFILDVMASISTMWTNAENEKLYENGLDMYEWYIKTGLPNGCLSSSVQCRLATLLLKICHVNLDYGKHPDCPSARTSIFELIRQGNVAVQFHLANRISAIFGLFILSNHSLMFDDLRETLPKDLSNVEGIAIRLLFFARLASAWHSLLRDCVFYIVETAGMSEVAAAFAKHGISELAISLRFGEPQKLFQLFAPQLLFSWLSDHNVNSLPYAIFGYASLEELVARNLAEITAQLLVKGRLDELDMISSTVKMSKVELLRKCAAKTEAYCISYDISVSSRDVEAESQLRTALGGKDPLNRLLVVQYPAILAQFFLSAQNEDVDDKWLEKRTGYQREAQALNEMKEYSHSDRALPTSQQPSFRSKWLVEQLERLCRRTRKADPSQRWDPAAFTYVARALLDSLDSALGPLHTCLVIRRLRLLVCLAGHVALVDYQLEMLIGSLRPYLNDSQCADDAMGLLRYLLHHGQPYLSMQMPFLRGIITLMLLQIRKHSRVRQESTTQTSQHHATLDKMHGFHAWLVQYLKSCQPTKAPLTEAHATLVQSLAQVQLPGNAKKSTAESALLLILIENEQGNDGLFQTVHRDEALLMLSENFQTPVNIDEDCLADDAACVRMLQQLWYVAKLPNLSSALLGWIAGALGRAYAASGQRPLHHDRDELNAIDPGYDGVARSQAAIANRLARALCGDSKAEASTADTTLREALLSFNDAEECLAFENMLPATVVPAMLQSDKGYAPVLHPTITPPESSTIRSLREPSSRVSLGSWVQAYAVLLCLSAGKTPLLPALLPALRVQTSLCLDLLPMIVHILLVMEHDGGQPLKSELSSCMTAHFGDDDPSLTPKQSYLLKLLLYLRAQPLPNEHTQADRLKWLDVDCLQAADAASKCNMPEVALLFAESATAPSSGHRRASSRVSMSQVSIAQIPQRLLLSVFKNVDEPDSFYGVEQPASLDSVLDRFDFEGDGFHSLSFRSAQMDAQILQNNNTTLADSAGMMRSLSLLNLNSLTFALLSSGGAPTQTSSNELLSAARKLQQWDIAVPELADGPSASCFAMFQDLSRATSQSDARSGIQRVLLDHVKNISAATVSSREWFAALASIIEVDEVVGSASQSAMRARWECMQTRQHWMHLARFEDISLLSTNRQIMFSTLVRNEPLLRDMHGAMKDSRAIEVEALLGVASFAREHGKLQEALTAVRQAGDLAPICESTGLHIASAVKLGTASVLWDLGEATASVKMLQETLKTPKADKQDIEGLGKAGLLARLAHQLGDARLESADSILANYLEPAIKQLGSRTDGMEAGEVFHEFATFCDKQLLNPGSIEDFERISRLRQKKLEEVQELERLSSGTKRGAQRDNYGSDLKRANKWFQIDDADYQRLKHTRDTFMQQSLQNYMLTLRATDKYNISVLRLFALWLENADVAEANHIATKYLANIPSWKFVLLMNQLMSRLENDGSPFQKALATLLYRICSDHPHHSLNHLFAATRRPHSDEQAAVSRHRAAMVVRQQVSRDHGKGDLLNRVFNADKLYTNLAFEDVRSLPSKATTNDLQSTRDLRERIPGFRVPPITLNIALRPNADYSDVPVVTRFGSTVRVMTGISKPKAISVYASDGRQYSQLFKSGNDDLRQDAIMEQVFEEVSKMLRNHKATRQRNLVVRTYKVIPLSATAGAIEFVPNSMSFGDFLKPAHQRYNPQDIKDSKARQMISDVQNNSNETRAKVYRQVCDHMHPVMRHFFFERFIDPEEWFRKRTAYTRTTATISILGHVLGLGDRHCQNIMLDEKTGEVVHIDLGVAFEAGRVLPIPEMVPFRLSRDVVDGMGVTKTEGVFRRCCEFTMDALREDQDSIMTLLNVLRYDPLYTWSVSPLRAKRMQDETGREQGAGGGSKKKESEAGEAERALSIVEKKLSKTLSTAATVNELIQQATDERNLATLYSGWSAWF